MPIDEDREREEGKPGKTLQRQESEVIFEHLSENDIQSILQITRQGSRLFVEENDPRKNN